MTVLDIAALSANHLTHLLAAKDTLKQVLAGRWLQSGLEPIKEQIKELLGILLLGSISGTAIKLFKGEAEAERIVIHPVGKLKVSKELLHLMEHVVVNFSALVLFEILFFAVVDAEQVVT